MFVIHANWTAGNLHLWAESLDHFANVFKGEEQEYIHSGFEKNPEVLSHPFVLNSSDLKSCLDELEITFESECSTLTLNLPDFGYNLYDD